jgi:spermidine synthase
VVTTSAIGRPAIVRREWPYAIIAACFALSGAAAILYQTIWSRLYGLILGTSEAAVSVVLAHYMLGLALGAAIILKWPRGTSHPLKTFALIESGIAVCGLALPFVLMRLGDLYVSLAGSQPDPVAITGVVPLAFFALCCVVLLIPTALMGATLPVLARYTVHSSEQTGPRIAGLYAANTLGAAAGAIASGWWLVPAVGLKASTSVAVGLNLLVAGIAITLLRARTLTSDSSEVDPPGRPPTRRANATLAAIAAGCGFVALLYEVLWTRMLSHVLGSSLAAFSTMLASFLLGIGIGSLLSTRRLGRFGAMLAFSASQLGVAATAALAQLWLESVPIGKSPAELATQSIFVMLPATVFMGAAFPLLIRLLSDHGAAAATATAKIYAANTVGAVAGALGTGLWLVPWLGFEGTAQLAVGISLVIATVALAGVSPLHPLWKLAGAMVAAAGMLTFRPSAPQAIIDASLIDDSNDGQIRYFAVGRSSTVLVKERDDGSFYLRTNGLPEATVRRIGSAPQRHSQRWLAALPVAARPTARSMLIVGLGGGVAAEQIPAHLTTVDIIELERRVIDANTHIGLKRATDPLSDPRVRLIANDARNALQLTDRRYDIIVSQPSHPWTSGAANLYSREFLQLARSRLAPDGVILFWINAQFIDEHLLRSIAATIGSVFSETRLYRPEPLELMFMASDAPIEPERLASMPNSVIEREVDFFSGAGILAAEDLAASLAASRKQVLQLSERGELISDDRNILATKSSPVRNGLDPDRLQALLGVQHPFADATVDRGHPELRRTYIGARLASLGFASAAIGFARVNMDNPAGAYTIAAGLNAAGKSAAAQSLLDAAAMRFPADADIAFAKIRSRLLDVSTAQVDKMPIDLSISLSALPDSARAVVDGWGMAAAGQWSAVRTLDSRLAKTASTDAWFSEANQLRTEWRTNLAMSGSNAPLAKQALRLIDQGIAWRPNADLYTLRAAAALALRDAPTFLESASGFATLELAANTKLSLTDGGIDHQNSRVSGFLQAVNQRILPFDEQRAAAVARQLQQLRTPQAPELNR